MIIENDRRGIKQRYETIDCHAVLSSTIDPEKHLGQVININEKGVLLRGSDQVDGIYSIDIKLNEADLISSRVCKVKTRDGDIEDHKDCFVQFEKSLNWDELNKVACANEDKAPRLWTMLCEDIKDVKEEIYRIERCRSDIFLAIITAVFLTTITVGCLAVDNKMGPNALLVASVTTFLMFVLGAYTTIEKARALNERRSVLVVLNKYYLRGLVPMNYAGWAKIKYFPQNCGALLKLQKCPLGAKQAVGVWHKFFKGIGYKSRKDQCRFSNLENIMGVNRAKRFMPGMSSSFMSMISYVYSSLYVFSVVIISVVLINYLSERFDLSFAFGDTFFMTSLVLSGVAISLTFLMRFRHLLFFAAFAGVLILSLASYFFKIQFRDDFRYVLLLSIACGFLLGSVGAHMLVSLHKLRKGSRSIECYYHMWQLAIPSCCSLVDICSDYKGTWLQRVQEKLWGSS